MSDRIEVCPADELGPGDRRVVEDGKTSIGVFNVAGEYYAMLNSCQHQYGPTCEGKLIPGVEADPGEVGERTKETLTEDEHVAVCPWHGWKFDVTTGENIDDDRYVTPTYEVEVENGEVFLRR